MLLMEKVSTHTLLQNTQNRTKLFITKRHDEMKKIMLIEINHTLYLR